MRPSARAAEPGSARASFPYGIGVRDLGDALPIAVLLGRVVIPEGVPLRRFAYASYVPPEGPPAIPCVQVGLPWRHHVFDARDGSLLEARDWAR